MNFSPQSITLLSTLTLLSPSAISANKPNFVIIFCDDLGYGDLGCYGDPSIKTPNLDRMAYEGQKWTSFYVAASVSTPSRAALMTGRYPIRNGQTKIYFPYSDEGLHKEELTIAELLKQQAYTTACVGKWHLGHKKEYLPLNNGFDYYYGIPYSNDMSEKEQRLLGNKNYPYKLPFFNQHEIVEYDPDQSKLTERLTDYAIDFIEKHRKKPFFLYLAHPMPHVPVYASDKFKRKSTRGAYGDCIEEVDHYVGEVINTLKKNRLDKNTIVIFTSDNGPWLSYREMGGSAGVLKDGKQSAYEGGFRVPCIMWGMNTKPGTITGMASTLDILPTLCQLAQVDLPEDRIYDGISLLNTITEGNSPKREELFYYRETELYAARRGDYKAIYMTKPAYKPGKKIVFGTPELYNVATDPEERYNIAEKHPEIIQQINESVSKHKKSLLEKSVMYERKE